MTTEFLYEEPFQVVVPASHKWAKRKSVQPAELAAENTILLNVGHCFRDQVLESCPELNRADAHMPRTNSLETVRNMVASGLGISVLPRDALTPQVPQPHGGAGAVCQASAEPAGRAGLPAELSAAGGHQGRARCGGDVPRQAGGG